MEKKQKRVYYAHSMLIYDKRREKKELKFLKKHFKLVFNPKTELMWDDSMKMEPYFEAVRNSSIVVFTEFKKHIGKGVYDEIKTALYYKIQLFCLRKRYLRYKLLQVKNIELVDPNDWKIRYGKIKLKK